MSKPATTNCKKCRRIIHENTNLIECDCCKNWYHIRCCKLKIKEFTKFTKITPFNLFVFSVTMQNALNVQNLFLAIKMVSNVIHVTPGATLPVQDLVLNNA